LCWDKTGVFSNNLIGVSYSDGGIWRIDSATNAVKFADTTTNAFPIALLEGVITIPVTATNLGPWAGKIITGSEQNDVIYSIDTNAVVTPYPNLGIKPEDFKLIPANQDLYCADYDNGLIVKLSRNYFTNNIGDLLIVKEGGVNGGGEARLYVVRWDGTNFVSKYIPYNTATITNSLSYTPNFEHVTFAPINLPTR